MEKTSLKMILHALPQDDMMELEQMIDSRKKAEKDHLPEPGGIRAPHHFFL